MVIISPKDATEAFATTPGSVVVNFYVFAGFGMVGIPPSTTARIVIGGEHIKCIISRGQMTIGDANVLTVHQRNAISIQAVVEVFDGNTVD